MSNLPNIDKATPDVLRATAIRLRGEAVALQHHDVHGVRCRLRHDLIPWDRVDNLVRLAGDYDRAALA